MRAASLALALLASPVAAEERAAGPNLLPSSLWRGVSLAGRGFYPRGFSPDGWFAFTRRPAGDLFEGTTEGCPSRPCRDGVTIVSLVCEDPCRSDGPSSPGDRCWCPIGQRLRNLAAFKIAPLAKDAARGRFPARIAGQAYDLELRYGSKLVPSEAGSGHVPGTQVFLVGERSGRKRIATLEHGHRAIVARSVKAIGWLLSPCGKRLAVVLGYLARQEGKHAIEVEVVGASL